MVRHARGKHARLFGHYIARAFGKEDTANIRRAAPHRRVKRGGYRHAADLGMGGHIPSLSSCLAYAGMTVHCNWWLAYLLRRLRHVPCGVVGRTGRGAQPAAEAARPTP